MLCELIVYSCPELDYENGHTAVEKSEIENLYVNHVEFPWLSTSLWRSVCCLALTLSVVPILQHGAFFSSWNGRWLSLFDTFLHSTLSPQFYRRVKNVKRRTNWALLRTQKPSNPPPRNALNIGLQRRVIGWRLNQQQSSASTERDPLCLKQCSH